MNAFNSKKLIKNHIFRYYRLFMKYIRIVKGPFHAENLINRRWTRKNISHFRGKYEKKFLKKLLNSNITDPVRKRNFHLTLT